MKEQQRWRDEGELEKLPAEQQRLLKAWESARTAAAHNQLRAECAQWTEDGLTEAEVAAKAKEWWEARTPGLTPWWTNGVFIGACTAFILASLITSCCLRRA